MAARSPSAFTHFIDTSNMVPRGKVLETGPSAALDDQVMVQSKQECLVSDVWRPGFSQPAAWYTFSELYFAFDACDGSSTCAAKFSLLAWLTDDPPGTGFSDFYLALYHNGTATRHSLTVSASHDSKIWRAWTDITIYSDGSENHIDVQGYLSDPYYNYLYVAGCGIFTEF